MAGWFFTFNIQHSTLNIQHSSLFFPWNDSAAPHAMMPAMFVLYEVLLYLVLVLALPYFLFTGVLRGKYLANFQERMGFYRTPGAAHDLWIHAVSVGETLAARPVVDAIMRRRPSTT